MRKEIKIMEEYSIVCKHTASNLGSIAAAILVLAKVIQNTFYVVDGKSDLLN